MAGVRLHTANEHAAGLLQVGHCRALRQELGVRQNLLVQPKRAKTADTFTLGTEVACCKYQKLIPGARSI